MSDRFILKNIQTGYTKELKKIVPRPGEEEYESTMAEFYTKKGGIITDER
ncbi:hypothetical protein NLC82_04325 [Candidatus Aminicenantes bacterium AC-335-A11]|jgi:hypothetical protein|nr:hypothetical protein [SCandidatus Aminicenantes bacterium Aminicenantia_JdfR_composite]MCP2618628.1 hypothetical protein [Candidatus Aminicenantes bacterium AC-335-A11]MCP2620971.1 hypothetical protein [Candidatus Aminicenantes bacterium AC-334-E05]